MFGVHVDVDLVGDLSGDERDGLAMDVGSHGEAANLREGARELVASPRSFSRSATATHR